ncbi:MAG: hypothetical protein AAF845_01580 [Bacteroidota bacterium]
MLTDSRTGTLRATVQGVPSPAEAEAVLTRLGDTVGATTEAATEAERPEAAVKRAASGAVEARRHLRRRLRTSCQLTRSVSRLPPTPMHRLLEEAFDRASSLPAQEQEALARRVLAELDADVQWDDLLARPESDDLLTRLADEALAAHREGRTRPLDPDDL